ncbi:MAG: hypothetical protein HYY40_14360 [Bacteroidetes bacterium]|nr:hypothetical protein [Bacteroidota bacterium]
MMAAFNFFHRVLLIGLALTFFSFDLPQGWFKAGNKPGSYEMGTDKWAGQDGKNAATIKSKDKKINGFGTLMQNCLPDMFRGKRVRMTGYMKSKDVIQWAGFWLRVDQPNSNTPLSFDNMHDRSVKGTSEWQKYEIVLDVPLNSSNIAYGALLAGTGQIWFDNLSFEVVDNSIPVTGKNNEHGLPHKEPANLDFEKIE